VVGDEHTPRGLLLQVDHERLRGKEPNPVFCMTVVVKDPMTRSATNTIVLASFPIPPTPAWPSASLSFPARLGHVAVSLGLLRGADC
jgi:hypothetical protein